MTMESVNTPVAKAAPEAVDLKGLRLATPVKAGKGRERYNGFAFFCMVVALFLGFGCGALWMRQRQKARDILFAVNGTTIDRDTLFHRLDTASGTDVVHRILQEELLLQFAKQKGLEPTEAQVEAKYAEAVLDPDYAKMMTVTRLTTEDVKRAMRLELSELAVYGQGVTASDQEIRAFYKANIDKHKPNAAYYKPETVSIAIIVTRSESEGKKALASLRQGVAFATVAQNYSADPSKENGGFIPPIARGQAQLQRIPGLEPIIFGLKFGETTGLKQIAGAWWIIHCIDKSAERTQSFEEVKDDCRRAVLVTKGVPLNSKKMDSELSEFRNKATIQAFRPEYEILVHPQDQQH